MENCCVREVNKVNLFCLTFAGGNKFSYRTFSDKSPDFLNLITLEYPGRGRRINEPLIDDLQIIVDDLCQQFVSINEIVPFIFYGHSMGALVAYLMTLQLRKLGRRLPIQLILSGASGPSATSRREKRRYLMPKKEFIEEIRQLGGMPEELLENDDLLNFFEPILRSDFKAIETYQHKATTMLDIPVTIVTGTDEDLVHEEVLLWQEITTIPVDYKTMAGGHFFIFEHPELFLEILIRKTQSYILKNHEHKPIIS